MHLATSPTISRAPQVLELLGPQGGEGEGGGEGRGEGGGGGGGSLPEGITAEGCGEGDPWVKASTDKVSNPNSHPSPTQKGAGRERRSAQP